MAKKTYSAMGTQFIFQAYPQTYFSKSQVLELFDEAFLEIQRFENKFSIFKPSEFKKINLLAGVEACNVDEETLSLVCKAHEFSEKSNGAFDISYAALGQKWKTNQKEGKTLPEHEYKKLMSLVDYRHIQIDREKSTIFLPKKGMAISLGGIGKGYVVDSAFQILKEKGLINFMINGSGDIRVHSHSKAPRMWRIGIANPFAHEQKKDAGVIQIAKGSVSTSGSYVQFMQNAKRPNDHHIIRTKKLSSKTVISATILADECVVTDITGTICMALPPLDAISYLNEENLIGILIDEDGKSLLSQRALKRFGV